MNVNRSLGSWLWRSLVSCMIGLLPLSMLGQPRQSRQTMLHHVPTAVANGRAPLVGKLAASKTMQLAVVLPIRNQSELTSLLSELYNPASPIYHHFLTVQQFTDEFGPTTQNYQAVIAYFQKNGFTIRKTSRNRLVLDVSGTAAQVSAAFNVSMNVYQDPNGKRTFFSPDRVPTLNLSIPIKHIEGLNDFSVPQPMYRLKKNAEEIANVTGSGPGGYYMGSDMRAAYYGGSLLTGAGQSVGLFEYGGYRISDVDLTFSNAGQSYSVPINNPMGNFVGADDTEQVLDIVQTIEMAPGLSQVRVYVDNGYPGNDADIFNEMASENICKELSVSWSWVPDDPTTDDGIFQEFATQGQSIFVASGDYGAYDRSVSPYFYPAEDAYVTTVGATHLTTNYGGGPWVGESAWNDGGYGSGGGVSPDAIPLPTWQQAVAATWSSGNAREVPDVAMEGDSDNYYCDMGTCQGGAGGTSFAAPRWAGFMALVNQQAEEVGSAPLGGLGFINSAIYSIGEGSNFSSDFHDITEGNNDTADQPVWYSAVPGYDLVTGWGSPNGQNLIDALAGTLVPGFWLTTAPPSLSVNQGGSGATTVSVIEADGFAGTVNLSASRLPTGVTATFSPPSTTGTSELTFTADSSAATGTASVTITGSSGTLTASTQVFLTVNPPQPSPPPVGELGSVNVGSTGNPTAVTLTFKTAGTLGNIAVLTQGSPNLDFADAGGDTCAVGTAYAANSTCTVNIAFSPKYSGARYGAVMLTDSGANQLAETYLGGTGIAPQTTFNPGSETTIGSGFSSPDGIAITGDGSIYLADYGTGTTSGALYLEKFSNGFYTQSQLNCTLKTPVDVAVDGGGTVYVADSGAPAVYKITIINGSCSQTSIGSGFGAPQGVAVDRSGNVYIADIGSSSVSPAVYKETLQPGGTYVQTTIGSGWIAPVGVAVDPDGNIDIADYAIPGVFKETLSGGSYTQTPIGQGWTAPGGIAVDGSGNVYVSDAGNSLYEGGLVPAGVYKEVASGGSYTQTPIGTGWTAPFELTVDAMGDVLVADQLRGFYKEDLTDPPQLSFANASEGTTSSDSPRIVTVSNIGTATLNFSAVSYPADFPEAGASSSDCTPSTSLQTGQACTLTVEFLPTTSLGGYTSLPLNESVTITTNTLNTTATQQAVLTSGTEVQPGGSVSLGVSANPSAAGSSVTFTATVAGSNGGPVPTGTVTFYNGTSPLSGPISLINAVATYATTSLAVGTYAISASYSGDGNYSGSTSSTITESILAAPGIAPIGTTDLGNLNVGSTGSTIPLTFTFSQAETLGGIAVLTQGAPNLDFTNAGGGTCTIGNAFTVNSTCTVNVTFSPKYPGVRYGAVVLTDNSGNTIGTGYLEGTGTGPQTAFSPGTLTSLGSGLYSPQGIAVDGAGNVYIADALNAAVYKETLANGTYTQSTIGSGFTKPDGVAVDGAGNVYVADSGTQNVYKEIPLNGSYTQTVLGYGFSSPAGVAVDGFGNIYVADFGNGITPGAVYVEALSNGSYAQANLGGTFVTPEGVAVDGNGNVFVADSANGSGSPDVYELTPSNGTYTQTSVGYGWVTPTGVAVDGNGNVFVADDAYDLGTGFVAMESLQPDGTHAQTIVADSSSVPDPATIALDGSGNRYIADNFEGAAYRQDIADPPTLNFAATTYAQTSSDSPQTVTVQNIGNATLAFSALSYPADFPESLGVPSDCTAQSTLAPESGCTLTIDFAPLTELSSNQPKSLAENLTVTTNSVTGSTQSLAVTGTEASPTISVALTAPANVATVGAPLALTAIVTGQNGLATPTGSVTFYNGGAALGSSSLNSSGTATFSISSLPVGIYYLTAAYSGDQVYPQATSNMVTATVIPGSTFGTVSAGNTSTTSITVTFSAKVTLGSITVLTDGLPNLDFTTASGGTCTIGHSYSAGATCTVNVSFSPRLSGIRRGALDLGDNKGHLIQTLYIQGMGAGPQVSFQPAIPTTIFTQASGGLAVDSNGDVYTSPSPNTGQITKWTPNNGSYTSTLLPYASVDSGPVAVDGAGNVYSCGPLVSRTSGNYYLIKQTLFAGTYTESSINSSCGQLVGGGSATIVADGSGNIYFTSSGGVWEVKPGSSGSYAETQIVSSNNIYAPYVIALDEIGNIYLGDSGFSGTQYLYWILKETPTGNGTYTETMIFPMTSVPLSLDFVDANGDLYITKNYQTFMLTPSASGYISTPAPTNLVTTAAAMGANGNIYYVNGNSVMMVNSASSPSLQFKPTTVGSKSTDSPEVTTLQNVGNAPLTFSVPSSGTNPSVAANFALDSSSTCPQISVSGSPSSLGMNASCTYALDFTPTATGTINGSVVVSDNALNAVGGTQTIPLSGSGTSGTGGNAVLVTLTIGPGGVPHGVLAPNQSSTSLEPYSEVWVDAVHQTFVNGYDYLVVNSQGQPTCTLYSQAHLTAGPGPLFGTLYYYTEYYYIQGCGSTLFPFRVARYTRGPKGANEQDKFVLQVRDDYGRLNEYGFIAEFAHITVTPAVQIGSGSNPPLAATATLVNPPPNANGYKWTILGGGGAIVFLNGEETIDSTNPSIVIEEPNPTAAVVPFIIEVDANWRTTNGAGTLTYGPTNAVISMCPSNISVGQITSYSLANTNGGSDVPQPWLTGIGIVADMQVGPSSTNWNGTQLTESLTTKSNSCPANWGNLCPGSTGIFTVGQNALVTFPAGNGEVVVGTEPAVENQFYDTHGMTSNLNVLNSSNISACSFSCMQSYSCGGKVVATFTITKTLNLGTVNNYSVTNVAVTKQ